MTYSSEILWEVLGAYPLVSIEALVVAAVLILGFLAPGLGGSWLRAAEAGLGRLAGRRGLSVLVVGLTALSLRLALLPLMPVPEPTLHDEFGYLLSADTFASGRVTNPPHPLWQHFETLHILQQPTYSSIHPVGQGLALAAGTLIGGHPWVGVWLSCGLMCALLCWMLQGWLPPRWALVGGLLAAVRLGALSYWSSSYWGGAVAAAGGALVLGALPRLSRRRAGPRVRDALLLAAGVAVLAVSRPFEGLVLCVLVAAALLAWVLRHRGPALADVLRRAALPMALVLAAAGAATAYYNWRVTGHALLMPYQLNKDTYGWPLTLIWQTPGQVTHRHEEMRRYYRHELHLRERLRSAEGLMLSAAARLRTLWLFYLGPALTLSLVCLPWAARDRRIRLLLVVGAVSVLGFMMEAWFFPHYAAPMTGVIYAAVLQSLRHLRAWRWRGRPTGLFLSRAVPLTCVVMLALAVVGPARWRRYESWSPAWYAVPSGQSDRSRVLSLLNGCGGHHLVIVRYGPEHDFHNEWVYNEADIDGARVVWARDVGDESNARLVEYFGGRSVWLFEPDSGPHKITPYRVTGTPCDLAGAAE